MSFSIWCFFVGDPDGNIFEVNIDGNGTITANRLKEQIKAKKRALKDIDADHLTLHRVIIDSSLQKKARKTELNRLSENLNEDTELDAAEVLSASNYNNPPERKKYIILVRAPEGESIYCGAVAEKC